MSSLSSVAVWASYGWSSIATVCRSCGCIERRRRSPRRRARTARTASGRHGCPAGFPLRLGGREAMGGRREAMGGRAGRKEGGGVSFAERHAGCRALSENLEQHITKDQVSKSGTQHPFEKANNKPTSSNPKTLRNHRQHSQSMDPKNIPQISMSASQMKHHVRPSHSSRSAS